MKKLILLVGPPGSGKSTLALSYSANEGYVYINQDLQGKDHLALFDVALMAGKDIVIDRLNFSKGQRNRYLDPAKAKGYETKIIVLHESYYTCFHRCMERKDHLTIKDETNARSALNMFFSKYERVSDDEADEVQRIWPKGEKPLALINDLDGTVCNVDHRLHFVRREGKKDWFGFFKGIADDTPNQWCVDIIKAMSKQYLIVYCSGRPDTYRPETVEWLKKHDLYSFENGGPNYDFHLYMRPQGDSRQDSITKEAILDFELLTRFTIYFAIDDRSQVVQMWRKRGIITLQCADGEF